MPFFHHKGRLGKRGGSLSIRSHPIPSESAVPLALLKDHQQIKSHPDYLAAKSGDYEAASRLVRQIAMPLIRRAMAHYPKGCLFVAPHAIESVGENAIPSMLSAALAVACAGEPDKTLIQKEKVYHTGADPMERLNNRPTFSGKVKTSRRYVIVDDVATLGGTVSELASYIQRQGGIVQGICLIVNAGRSGTLKPKKTHISLLKQRHGDDIEKLFGIQPEALTADEASYLAGFRTTDEIRTRSIKAREKTDHRLRAKGIRGSEAAKADLTKARILFFLQPRKR